MQLIPEEAAQALGTIESSRQAMRSAVVAHRGHLYLWLWGCLWVAMALLAQWRGLAGVRLFSWISLGGGIVSVVMGIVQRNQVRRPIDRRFLAVIGVVIAFAVVFPTVLGIRPRTLEDARGAFAYISLVAMLCYVIAGIWFDIYLLWLGLAVAGLILVGLFLFSSIFWLWFAVFGGGTLIATGFYVRFIWKQTL